MTSQRVSLIVVLFLLAAQPIFASPLYSVTDLGIGGGSATFDANGNISGVMNSNDSENYAFDKSPVTHINERIDSTSIGNYAFTMYTLQDNGFKTGYFREENTGQGPVNVAISESVLGSWYSAPNSSPITDMNALGQFIGTGQPGVGGSGNSFTYAAIGYATGATIPPEFTLGHNLNSYIATIPGMSLTSAFNIDDVGRIIAGGSDGHTYLLTPIALGAPQTVPEPSGIAIFLLTSLVATRVIARRTPSAV